jgi:hypothetical protein
VGLLGVGCYPSIDPLVTGEPPLDTSRNCTLPSPELGVAAPAGFPETRFPELAGTSHPVAPGADLQAVVDAALPGDEIVLQAGAEYPGPVRLPYKPEPGTIVIRSSALAELAEGRTVTLEDAPKLATILGTDTDPAVIVEEQAKGYRLAGLELRPSAGVASDTLLVVGSRDSTLPEALPTEIVVDRMLVRGDPAAGGSGGIELSSRSAAILDSRVTDIKVTSGEASGLLMNNTPGPVLVHNSVIEASWQNVTIGEGAPGAPELAPSDIAICKSVLAKPGNWQSEGWSIKALLGIGRGRRLLLAGTLIDGSGSDVYPGFGLLIRDQGASQGIGTEDIALVNVRMRNIEIALEVETSGVTGSVARLVVENSELSNIPNRMARLLGGGVQQLSIVHTTALVGSSLLDGGGVPNPELLVRDGLFDMGLYGIRTDGVGSGTIALDAFYAPWTVHRNILVGAGESAYPPDNFYPPTLFEAGVVDANAGNYRLAPGSQFAGLATDGTDPGADIDVLEAALPSP